MDGPAPEAEWTEGDVESNGVRLHYVRTGGDGPPLVVAHGVYDDATCRTPLLREFGDDYDVVAYDARGHGQSDTPEGGYGVDERVADLAGLLDALDLTDPVLFGHSMGGDTVVATAARYPDLPRGVVLVDPACMLARDDDRDRLAVVADVREKIGRWHDRSVDELLAAEDGLRALVEEGDEQLARLLARARQRVSPNVAAVFEAGWLDPEEAFADVVVPTLVLRADVTERRREVDRQRAAALAEGRLVHVDGAGHCVFRDERERATAEMRTFLDDI